MTSDAADFFTGLARDVALGATLGPVGAGAGAAVAVVSALSDAVGLTQWLSGATAPATRQAVAAAVQVVTGTADLAGQSAVLARDPAAVDSLRLELARIAAQMQTQADADRAGARAQTVALAGQRSTLAWGAPLVSLLVLLAYGAVTALVIVLVATRALPDGAIAVLTLAMGSLSTMAGAVVSYWVGSSAGSARKSDAIERLTAGT